jgi:hypothetical protein
MITEREKSAGKPTNSEAQLPNGKAMTKEDVIRMAREAGAKPSRDPELWDIWNIRDTDLERFAALVAAHEREKVAKWMVERGYATGHGDTVEDLLTEIDWQAAEPKQELMIDCPRCGHCCPQHNQEFVKDKLDFWALFDENQRLRAELKFNTTPPQQWVGLTDNEVKSLPSWWPSYEDAPALIQLVKDVEAKLKDKNT